MDSFALWLQEQRTNIHFNHFMNRIKEQRDYKHKHALAQGDTEFAKGYYHALDYVVNLPEEIYNELTATDTSEPLA